MINWPSSRDQVGQKELPRYNNVILILVIHVAVFNSLRTRLFFRQDSPQRAKKSYAIFQNIIEQLLTLLSKLPHIIHHHKALAFYSFICRIAKKSPYYQKVLFLPKIVFFTLDQKLAKPYFSFFSSASL
jgi:hypothetical protein